jgi:hypothetical protein
VSRMLPYHSRNKDQGVRLKKNPTEVLLLSFP